MFYYGFDWTYVVLVLPAVVLALIAQAKVSSTFKKYAQVPSDGGMTGADAARMVLDSHGVTGVQIVPVSGELTDHFDPKDNVIRLSESVFSARTASAVGVAAHEAGHAVQYAENYVPMQLRAAVIPMTKVGSYASMPLIILGLIFSIRALSLIGVILFGFTVLFQLVTLPVEFNASRRAVATLESSGRVTEDGVKSAKKVLTAAAMTYVAALAVAVANLLRLLILIRRND